MNDYLEYLKKVQNKADNTVLAYGRDLQSFERFLEERGGKQLDECNDSDATAYMLELGKRKKSKATINRNIASLRGYYDFRISQGDMEVNPFAHLKTMKNDIRKIDYLELEEVEALLELPDQTPKGLRDRAIMELMYGTGIRVSELVRLKYSDLNLRMRFLSCRDANDNSRVIPIGSYAYSALKDYMEKAYGTFVDKEIEAEDSLFVNMHGKCITRQGVWKILKEYGDRIGLSDRMTPQILRDTFAVHILQNGGDLRTLQELMGFEDLAAGLAYLSCIDIHIKDVYNRTHPRA